MSINPSHSRSNENVEGSQAKLTSVKETLEMYKDVFDALYDEVHIWKLIRHANGEIKTWQLIDANTVALRGWNKQKHEVLLKTADEIFLDADATASFMPIVKKIFAENKPCQWERFFAGTGQTLLMKSIPLGEYFISTGLDISLLKQAQEDLRASNLRLTEATSAGKVGIWDWFIPQDIMDWDDQMYLIYGAQKSDDKKNVSLWEDALHPEDAERAKKAVMDTINYDTEYNIIFRIVLPDGRIRHIKGNGTLLRDQQGNAVHMLGTNLDITDTIEAERRYKKVTSELKVFASEKQAIFDAIIDSVIVINQHGTIQDCNKATTMIFGYARSELIGQKVNCLMEKSVGEQHDGYLRDHLEKGVTNIIGKGREVMARTKSGQLFHAFLSVAKYSDGEMTQFVGTLKNIEEDVQQRMELEFNALHDSLTKLPTRRLFEQNLEQAISASMRQSKTFYILFIDLNKFKFINDTFGHEVGDKVLKHVSQSLLDALRPEDTCARLGGDEFVVLCQPSKDEWNINDLKNKLVRYIAEPLRIAGYTHHIEASIGVAKFPVDGKSVSELLKSADMRMYEQKMTSCANCESNEAELVALTYISHSLIPDEKVKEACQLIRKVASQNNAEKKISGILFFCRNRFIQRLEGPKKEVDELVEKIKQDSRHRNFSLLSYNFIEKRAFVDWSHIPVHHNSDTFAQLDAFLLNIELNDSKTLNEKEALFIVDFLKQFEGIHPSP